MLENAKKKLSYYKDLSNGSSSRTMRNKNAQEKINKEAKKIKKNAKKIKKIDKIKKMTGLSAAEKAGKNLYEFVTGK